MKNNEIQEPGLLGSGGVCIEGDIRLKYSSYHSSELFFAFRMILAFMATFATATLANSFTDSGISSLVLLYNSAIAVAGLSLLMTKHKILKLCAGLVTFIYTIPILTHLTLVKYGSLAAAHGYFTKGDLPDQSTGLYRQYFVTRAEVDQAVYYFFTALIFVLALGSVIACVIRLDFPIIFIFTFPVMELGLYLGFEVPAYAALMILVTWITLLSVNLINHTTNKAGRNNTFAVHERSRTFYFTSAKAKSGFYTVYMRFVALITAAVFAAIMLFSAISGFERPRSFEELRYNLHHAVEKFDIAHADDFLINANGGSNLFGVTTVGGTNGGVLGETSGISFNGSTAMILKTEHFSCPMYLRGYVAGKYEDNSWNALEKDTEIQGITEELEEIGAWVQDYDYLLLMNNDDLTGSRAATMDITVKGACSKFVYAPYATQYIYSFAVYEPESGMIPYNDSYVRISQSEKNYLLEYKAFGDFDWSTRAERLQWADLYMSADLRDIMERYEDYVYKNYTDAVELGSLDEVYDYICDNYLTYDPELHSYREICGAIKRYFDDMGFTYDLNPGKTPKGEDYIDYFLTKQKKGYCAYYATVGVQLMRKFGYPARYVEGYMVLPDQLDSSAESNGLYEVTVQDKCAHAWTEVFVDGAGWLPADFTPGYDNDNPNLTNKDKGKKDSDSSKSKDSSSSKRSENSSKAPKPKDSSKASENSRSDSKRADSSKRSENSRSDSKRADSSSLSSGAADPIGGNGSGGNGGTGGNGGSGGKPAPGGSDSLSPVARTALMTLFAVMLSVAAVLINRKRSLDRMRASCSQKDLNKRVLAIYTYSLKYLSALNIQVKKNISDMQICSELLDQCHEQRIHQLDEKLQSLTVTAVKAHMYPRSITAEEAAEAESVMRFISDEVVAKKLGRISMLSAKYLYCLY